MNRPSSHRRTRALGVGISLLAMVLLGACASTKVRPRETAGGDLPRPERIVVYDFATSPEEIGSDNPVAEEYEIRDEPQTEADRQAGAMLARGVAAQLVSELGDRGIDAIRAENAGDLAVGDYLIKGEFVSFVEGSTMRRLLIGFGSGNSELQTLVQIYRVTPDGTRRVAEVEFKSEGSKMPGMLVPVGVGAAAGTALRSAAISGGVGTARELGSGPLAERAEATAEEIAKRIEKSYETRGWK